MVARGSQSVGRLRAEASCTFPHHLHSQTECAEPSHSQSLANLVAKLPFARNSRNEDETLTISLTLQPFLSLEKKQGKPRKKQGFSLFAQPPKSLEKEGKTHKKARPLLQDKSEIKKSKENEKSKDWRVRVHRNA